MFRKDGMVRFYRPNDKYFSEIDVCVDINMRCSFISPMGVKRCLRMSFPTVEGENGIVHWNAFISPESKVKGVNKSLGGLTSLVLDENGGKFAARFEFMLFEKQIYLLTLQFKVRDLIKVTSDNPEQDWQWLRETLEVRYDMENNR